MFLLNISINSFEEYVYYMNIQYLQENNIQTFYQCNNIKKIYLLITDSGGGHSTSANALKRIIEERLLNFQVHIVSVYSEVFEINTDNMYNFVLKNNLTKFYQPICVPIFKQTSLLILRKEQPNGKI